MSISKFILFGLSLTHAFLTPYNFIKPPKLTRCNSLSMNKNSSYINRIDYDSNNNSSKIFKIKYEFHKPKMRDYDIALVKFFIYGVINVYLFSYIYSSVK